MANRPEILSPRPQPNRPLKPRKPRKLDKPVMAVDKDKVLLEEGEVHSLSDLPMLVRTQPSSIVVAHHFGVVVRYLDSAFESNPLWQFKATPLERTSWAPNRKRQAVMKDCVISYFGFKGERKQAGHYHYALSPSIFCLKTVNELRREVPEETATITKLMEWAKEVREFLQAHSLNLSPTAGGVAAQLLRDDKFYPSARRKVPRHTNARTREELPGNYYKLYKAREGQRFKRATYLDQVSAHHTAAARLQFPDANTLYREGRYSTLEDKPFARFGTEKFDRLITQYGLFYLAIETPRFFDNDFPLPACGEDHGYRRGFFYSNELPYLETLGVRIRHIIASWTSPILDTGLNLYAEWAAEQVRKAHPYSKPWLKPTLLSTYGVLAAKPKIMEFGYKQAEGGEPKKYPCGSGFLDVMAKVSKKPREPLMSNVLHRGMIESQTRLESLQFARWLARQGHNILAIYADSLFVEGGKALPLLAPPWRVQEHLTGLLFQDSTHFTSQEVTKMPGIPENWRDRAKLPPKPEKGRLINATVSV